MHRLVPLLLGAALTLTACAPPVTSTPAAPLLVLAASDLQFALPEIAGLYESQGMSRITISLGSTGTFATQIQNGAPADLFFAADQSFIAQLAERDLIVDKTRQVYATGRIVLTHATGATPVSAVEDLNEPDVKRIAIANPEHAPYGRAARQALQNRGLWDQLQPKIVLGENIAHTFQLVQTGNADAAIVGLANVLGVPGTPYTVIDQSLYSPLVQEAAVLKSSRQVDAARDFLAYVNGPNGRPVMKKYGFVIPGE